MFDPIFVWKAQAVSSTTVYKSRVSTPPRDTRLFYQVTLTGAGATGALKGQVNTLPDAEYLAAVASAGSEAANDTGWVDQTFLQSDVTNASATFAMDASTLPTAVVNMPPGPYRHRLVFTNSGAAGTLNGYRRYA
jgi:hypothetical protein